MNALEDGLSGWIDGISTTYGVAPDAEASVVGALVASGRLKPADLQRMATLGRGSSAGPLELLGRFGLISEQDKAQVCADVLHIPLVHAAKLGAIEPNDSLNLDSLGISLRFLRQFRACPIAVREGIVEVVLADPYDPYPAQAIALATGLAVEPSVGLGSEIDALVERLFGQGRTTMGVIVETVDGEVRGDSDDVEHLRDLAFEAPVIRLVNLIIQRAVELRASDIHIEPFESRLTVRYRVDGVLSEGESPPANLTAAVISRIKIMAKLNIAERRLPQDGRIMIRVQGKELDLRVSTMPTAFGESTVMRLLDRQTVELDFQRLGFDGDCLATLQRVLAQPHGILLVTGPTGSGKTTTLYAALSRLNTAGVKIITVEDPVEYQIEGINQIQVKPTIGLDFSTVLRGTVRQDPDIIMVGEMRDLETARIAIQSALTGHLVLSTLHTNSAAGGVTRLLDMGVEGYLITSTVNAILAQRLVRRLEPTHAQSYPASAEEIERFGLRRFQPRGDIWLHRPHASKLTPTGYLGRTTIVELLVVDDSLREAIMRRAGADEIERLARSSGMRTMYEDGVAKALRGQTTLEEVLRVTEAA